MQTTIATRHGKRDSLDVSATHDMASRARHCQERPCTSTRETTHDGICSFYLRLRASDYTFGRYPGGVLALLYIKLHHGIITA